MSYRSFAVIAISALAACAEPAPSLVGTWVEVNPLPEPGPPGSLITFRADGTFHLEDDGVYEGTYAKNDELVALTPQGGIRAALHTISLTDERLMLDAASPEGAADGVVGTWRVEWTDGDRHVNVLTLAANGGAVLEETRYPNNGSDSYTAREAGSWHALSDEQIQVDYDRLTLPYYYFVADGRLSTRMYVRD